MNAFTAFAIAFVACIGSAVFMAATDHPGFAIVLLIISGCLSIDSKSSK